MFSVDNEGEAERLIVGVGKLGYDDSYYFSPFNGTLKAMDEAGEKMAMVYEYTRDKKEPDDK